MRIEWTSAAVIPIAAWRWPHVDPAKEWADKLTGAVVVDTDFMDRLAKLRLMFGEPLLITSGYRSPEHNQQVSSTGADGPHTTARAVDIAISGRDAVDLVGLAMSLGFTGFGLNQRGDVSGRYVHLDDLPASWGPRPMIWTYPQP